MRKTGATLAILPLLFGLVACSNESKESAIDNTVSGVVGKSLDEALPIVETEVDYVTFEDEDGRYPIGEKSDWVVKSYDNSETRLTLVVEPAEAPKATEKQVASVIAQYAPTWKDTIDDSTTCLLKSLSPANATDSMEGLGCRARETTVVIEADTAYKELSELNPPASMQTLVDETLTELDTVRNLDLFDACKEESGVDGISESCGTGLKDFMNSTGTLRTLLDKWSPYL